MNLLSLATTDGILFAVSVPVVQAAVKELRTNIPTGSTGSFLFTPHFYSDTLLSLSFSCAIMGTV